MYRPPTASVAHFNDVVDTIEKAHNTDKHMVILGDMNYNYVFDETMSENQISLLENMFLLKQLIDAPTRVTEIASNIIKANHKIIRFRDYNNFDTTACFNDSNQTYTKLMLKWNTNENQRYVLLFFLRFRVMGVKLYWFQSHCY